MDDRSINYVIATHELKEEDLEFEKKIYFITPIKKKNLNYLYCIYYTLHLNIIEKI